jgi:hypothetical protein
MTHVASPNASEIVGARDWLNKTAGIPKEKVVGFRAPYLMFDPQQREILQENGEWGVGAGGGGGREEDWLGKLRLHPQPRHPLPRFAPSPNTHLSPVAQASHLTPPSASSTPPPPPPLPASACGPTPWTTACPRTAPSGS